MSKPENKAERRQAAKERRLEEMRRRTRRQRLRRLRLMGIGVVVVAAIAGLVVFNIQRGKQATKTLNELAEAAGCTQLQTLASEGQAHNPPYTYKTDPPTSGNHQSPAATGVSAQPIPDESQPHNLEHGHVGIQYKDLDDDMLADLREIVRDKPTLTFLAPRLEMTPKLALTAWAKLITCDAPNRRAVDLARQFQKQFSGKGPEGAVPGSPVGV